VLTTTTTIFGRKPRRRLSQVGTLRRKTDLNGLAGGTTLCERQFAPPFGLPCVVAGSYFCRETGHLRHLRSRADRPPKVLTPIPIGYPGIRSLTAKTRVRVPYGAPVISMACALFIAAKSTYTEKIRNRCCRITPNVGDFARRKRTTISGAGRYGKRRWSPTKSGRRPSCFNRP
jgi:hypothetical protein